MNSYVSVLPVILQRLKKTCLALGAVAIASVGLAQSPLATLSGGTNQGSVGGGIYFDLEINAEVTVFQIDFRCGANTVAGTGSLDVYMGPTTYVNNIGSAALWTLAASAPNVAVAPSTVSTGTLAVPFVLAPGTYGVALKSNRFAFGYTNGDGNATPGTGTNQTFTRAEMVLRAGAAQNALFAGAILTPRVFNGAIHYTQSTSYYTTFGSGCPGSGAPVSGITGYPVLGGSFSPNVSAGRPNSPTLLWFGSDQLWNSLPLPLDLGALGFPGCTLLVSPDLILATATGSAGTAQVPIALPMDPSLLGIRFCNQWAVADPVVRLAVSNGGCGTIGDFPPLSVVSVSPPTGPVNTLITLRVRNAGRSNPDDFSIRTIDWRGDSSFFRATSVKKDPATGDDLITARLDTASALTPRPSVVGIMRGTGVRPALPPATASLGVKSAWLWRSSGLPGGSATGSQFTPVPPSPSAATARFQLSSRGYYTMLPSDPFNNGGTYLVGTRMTIRVDVGTVATTGGGCFEAWADVDVVTRASGPTVAAQLATQLQFLFDQAFGRGFMLVSSNGLTLDVVPGDVNTRVTTVVGTLGLKSGYNVWGIGTDNSVWKWDEGTTSWYEPNPLAELTQISVGSHGEVWGVHETNNLVWRWDAKTGSWYQPWPGFTLKQIDAGTDWGQVTLWGVKADNTVWKYDGGNGWIQPNPAARLKQVSVGDAHNVWGIGEEGHIFRWDMYNKYWYEPSPTARATQVEAASGGGHEWAWAIGYYNTGRIFFWGSVWTGWLEPGPNQFASSISALDSHVAWCIGYGSTALMVFRTHKGGISWDLVPGRLKQISVGTN